MNNAISVTIKPGAEDSIWFNSSQEFTAYIRDPRGKLMDVDPNWNISGFSSDVSISTDIGKSIIFYTGSTVSKGVLTAEYDGVRRFVNIEINNHFSLYENGKLSDKIDESNFLYGNSEPNPSDCIAINTVQDENGKKCFELIIKQPLTGNPVGFCLEFKIHEDLSNFTTLHFSMRSCDYEGNISFEYYAINETDDGDENGFQKSSSELPSSPTVGESFSDIFINIGDVSRNTTKELVSIEFTNGQIDPSPRIVRVTDIYLN
jgi:hypothetical protein